jgi:hypothetical protein
VEHAKANGGTRKWQNAPKLVFRGVAVVDEYSGEIFIDGQNGGR